MTQADVPGRSFVVAQLGQSLDGRIATVSGESRYINGRCALDHLHTLRATSDAVVIGAGTAIDDNPRLTVRRVPGRSPVRVIIDPRGRVPRTLDCFAQDGTAVFVIRETGCEAMPAPDRCEIIVLPRRGASLAPQDIVNALALRGLRRLLIEGGARTISAFIDAGAVDQLHVLVAPVLIGSGKPGLELRPEPVLAKAARPATRVQLFADGDVLFECDLKSARARPDGTSYRGESDAAADV